LHDGRSDVLRRQANLDTGEFASFLGKQLQGKRLRLTSRTYWEVWVDLASGQNQVCQIYPAWGHG